jgi:hypothetical protein
MDVGFLLFTTHYPLFSRETPFACRRTNGDENELLRVIGFGFWVLLTPVP